MKSMKHQALFMLISTKLSFRFDTAAGLHGSCCECINSPETFRQGSSSPNIQSISLNSAASLCASSRRRHALLSVSSAGMVTLLVKEAVRLPSAAGKRCVGRGGFGGESGLKWQLMAMSGWCCWEWTVSRRAFSEVCRMMVSLRDFTSSSSSPFLILSSLISLSKRTSFSTSSFSRWSLIDLDSSSFSIRSRSSATSSSRTPPSRTPPSSDGWDSSRCFANWGGQTITEGSCDSASSA